jgi:hypothetical protein
MEKIRIRNTALEKETQIITTGLFLYQESGKDAWVGGKKKGDITYNIPRTYPTG